MKTTNETTMTNLSPAAQAVIDAYWATPDEPITTQIHQAAVAAALRAAADQMVVPLPQTPSEYDIAQYDGREEAIANLLNIAAELEGFAND
jgi:hypothetical protein